MTRSPEPIAELDARFSSEGATPTQWTEARQLLEAAEVFWVSTVRPDGRPHVTPLIAVWLDEALYFCTGPTERKNKNLAGIRTASSRRAATRSTRASISLSRVTRFG
jgi:predicted pyridoxine 5'-phosphate oxidase superfamily flavin-nucleotide-binding protein